MNVTKRWAVLNLLIVFIFGFNQIAKADDAQMINLVNQLQKEMADMRKTIDRQNDKISRLENRPPMDIVAAPASSSEVLPMSDKEFGDRLKDALGSGGAEKWLKDLKFSGDMRLRYEGFNYSNGTTSETDDRNRFRYRLRYGFEKKFNEEMKVGFAMASGEQANGANVDPNSTNTTFDNNFNFKPLFIERVYGTYTPKFLSNKGILKKTEITAGKMANPFEKGSSDLIWDRDVRPEGAAERFQFNLIDTEDLGLELYTQLGQFVLDEDGTVGGDANLFAYQVGLTPSFRLGEMPVKWLHAVSLYDFSNYARKSNFLISAGANTTSLARTNPNVNGVTTELDAGKFKVIEYYSELGFNIINNIPAALSIDLAGNPWDQAGTGSTVHHGLSSDFAWALGLKLGGLKKKGDWEIGWAYKYIGSNAVPAGFNDSDFGDGFTGKSGNQFKIGYSLTDNISINAAAFFVQNTNDGTAGIIDQQQRRFQLDLVWKF